MTVLIPSSSGRFVTPDADIEHADAKYSEEEYDPSWSGEARTLHELAEDAEAAAPGTVQRILESGQSDADIARRLLGVIHGRNSRDGTDEVSGKPQARPNAEAAAAGQPAEEAIAARVGAIDDSADLGGAESALEPKGSYGITPQQYDLFAPEQRTTHDAARKAVSFLRRRFPTILGNAIASDFERKGHTTLLGQKVNTTEDLV